MGGTRELCTDLLTGGLDEPGVLFVSFTRQASTCVDQVDEAAVGRLGVITVGDGGTEVADADVTVSSISSPSDLTGLGIEIGQVLSEWEAPVAVCFDSLTAMLQYVDFETAYEFLHALTGQLYAADAGRPRPDARRRHHLAVRRRSDRRRGRPARRPDQRRHRLTGPV
jgi:hypothetical protein